MKKNVWRTFDEWSNLGYLILKGSKATVVDKQLKFNNQQIRKKPVNQFKFRTANGNFNAFQADSFDGHWENGSNSCGEENGYSPEVYG